MAFLLVLPFSIILTIITHRKIEECLTLPMIAVTFAAYICAFFWNFKPVIFGLPFLTVAAIVFAAVIFVRSNHKGEFLRRIFTPGLLFYLLMACYYLMTSYGRQLRNWDSLQVFGVSVRDFYYFNDIPTAAVNSNFNWTYIPGMQIWEFLSTKYWVTCSDGMMIFGQAVFGLSLLMPVFANIGRGKWKHNLLAAMLILLIPNFTNGASRGYLDIRMDIVLGVMSAYVIYNCREWVKTKQIIFLINSNAALAMMSLTKSQGVILGLICVFIISDLYIFSYQDIKTGSFLLLVSLACTVIPYFSWSWYLKAAGFQTGVRYLGDWKSIVIMLMLLLCFILFLFCFDIFYSKKGPKTAVTAILVSFCILLFAMYTLSSHSNNSSVKESMLDAFLKYLFRTEDRESTVGFGAWIRTPAVLVVFLLFAFSVFVIEKGKKKYGLSTAVANRDLFITIASVGGFLYYAICIYAINIFFRNADEASDLAEGGRYLYAYLTMLIALMLLIGEEYSNYFIKLDERASFEMASVVTLFCLTFASFSGLIGDLVDKPDRLEFSSSVETLGPGTRILLINQQFEGTEIENFYFYYRVSPAINLSGERWSNPVPSSLYRENVHEEGNRITISELTDALISGGINYVYLYNIDDEFAERYGSLFISEQDIMFNGLYKVDIQEDNNIKLIKQ